MLHIFCRLVFMYMFIVLFELVTSYKANESWVREVILFRSNQTLNFHVVCPCFASTEYPNS